MAQATLSCPFGAIHLENRRGTAPVGHYACGGVPSRLSPGPPVYWGRLPVSLVVTFRRAKSEWHTLFTPGHWALCVQNLVDLALKSRRLLWQSQGGWSIIAGSQRPPQSRTPGEEIDFLNASLSPTGAEAKRSFAKSSLPSFLSRKRASFFLEKREAGRMDRPASR